MSQGKPNFVSGSEGYGNSMKTHDNFLENASLELKGTTPYAELIPRFCYQMQPVLVAFIMLVAITSSANGLEALKEAAVRYVAAMKVALAISDDSDCPGLVAKANDYGAAKLAYYTAARNAMPALLQMAKGQKTDTGFGSELAEIFRDFGEETDEEATDALEAKLSRCPTSDQRDQARLAVDHAKQIADQFVKDFNRLEGV
jgi:hypothetical protein